MSLLGFSAKEIIAILQLGISGVAFVFLAMSFILLRKEQDRTFEPREGILNSIKSFSRVSFVFVLIVALSTLIERATTTTDAQPNTTGIHEQCQDAINRAELFLGNKTSQTVENLHDLLKNTVTDCRQ